MPQAEEDEFYMRRCLELATLGAQDVAPNPMVGAVLVHNGRIIGEGFHRKFGQAHAEVNAIDSVLKEDQSLLTESSLYVSLEPCSHHGKTPPCSDLIIESGIPRVVIGCIDSYSEVAGKGIQRLRDNNIDVKVGVLENDSLYLNRRFFTFHTKKRPYIILKWAVSSDGFLDKERNEDEAKINWITQPETQQLTHQWRAEEGAILVGKQTVLNDNPSLTVRAVNGESPIRLIITSSPEEIPDNSRILNDDAQTIIFNPVMDKKENATTWVRTDFEENILSQIMKHLHGMSIQSLIVEGGKTTLEHFIEQDFWDEARILEGVNTFENGILAPKIEGRLINQFTFGKDNVTILENA